MRIDGRCHCGYITYEAEIDPEKVMICHCTDCQTLSGSAFRTVVLTRETLSNFSQANRRCTSRPEKAGHNGRNRSALNAGRRSIRAPLEEGPKSMSSVLAPRANDTSSESATLVSFGAALGHGLRLHSQDRTATPF